MGTGRGGELSRWTGCCPDSAAQWSKLGHARPETQLRSTVAKLYDSQQVTSPSQPQFPALHSSKDLGPWSQAAVVPILASLLTSSVTLDKFLNPLCLCF